MCDSMSVCGKVVVLLFGGGITAVVGRLDRGCPHGCGCFVGAIACGCVEGGVVGCVDVHVRLWLCAWRSSARSHALEGMSSHISNATARESFFWSRPICRAGTISEELGLSWLDLLQEHQNEAPKVPVQVLGDGG